MLNTLRIKPGSPQKTPLGWSQQRRCPWNPTVNTSTSSTTGESLRVLDSSICSSAGLKKNISNFFLCPPIRRSLVFHVGDEWLEFFYPAMKPWVHFIPVPKNADEEELFNLIEFAKEHPDLSQKIADRGASFVKNNLRMLDVGCYWRDLLRKYTEYLTYKVVRDPKLKLVNPPP